MDVSYREACRMSPVEARRRLIEAYSASRIISAAAKQGHTSRSVVLKWLGRYRSQGL